MGQIDNNVLEENKEKDVGFVEIDRKKEDEAIVEFQKTGDVSILEDVYKLRIPTIRHWANQHYYPGLTCSVEDLFEEFSVVFVKAAEKYNKSRGAFNTCLYTFFLNRVKNIKHSQHAKKRISQEYKGAMSGMMLSLDYSYGGDNESEITLKDIVASEKSDDKDSISSIYLEDTINALSKGDNVLKKFLKKISDGESISSVIKKYKTKYGTIKISKDQAKKFSSRRCKRMVSEIIKSEINQEFTLLDYRIEGTSNLKYKVELKKTKETDYFMKSIREIRRNKEIYIKQI
jgi:hypothetical protein